MLRALENECLLDLVELFKLEIRFTMMGRCLVYLQGNRDVSCDGAVFISKIT